MSEDVRPHRQTPGPAYLRTILRDQAIRRGDCEALTRADIQYDMLKCIFDDTNAVFTNIPPRGPHGKKATFRDLYLHALLSSPLATRTLREQVAKYPQFADDFAKITLLVNVGRINTKMAFFPEMQTALRTYHPVPSLSKTGGNLQDAPRIRKMLKASQLLGEDKADLTLADILTRSRSGHIPPTTIINLIFTMTNYAKQISDVHFTPALDYHELFHPVNFTSSSRAQAFLWLCYHYLEAPSPNPFSDEYSRQHDGKAPYLTPLTVEERTHQNIDPEDEIDLAAECAQKRRSIVAERAEGGASSSKSKARSKGTRKAGKQPEPSLRKEESDGARSPSPEFLLLPQSRPRRSLSISPTQRYRALTEANVRLPSAVDTPQKLSSRPRRRSSMPSFPPQERSFLQNAWHSISTVDPLADSDEEDPGEHTRREYTRRLSVISRLRGQSPTPEPPDPHKPPNHSEHMEVDYTTR